MSLDPLKIKNKTHFYHLLAIIIDPSNIRLMILVENVVDPISMLLRSYVDNPSIDFPLP